MREYKEKGFTLVELLAVIVVLSIILAIAIPGISSIINSTTKGAFESDAKLLLKQLDYEKLKDDNFDSTTTSIDTISNFNLSNNNYEYLKIKKVNNDNYIIAVGKNKWSNLIACGTMKNIAIFVANNMEICEKTFDYTGNYQTFTAPVTGNYQIELWGAQGSGTSYAAKGASLGGKGAYTKGTLFLDKDQILYTYVGQGGDDFTSTNVSTASLYTNRWNGGGAGAMDTSEAADIGEHGFPGGGATDIRLVSGTWDNSTSLYSRIMVAAGGGGGGWSGNGSTDQYYIGGGGAGGDLIGIRPADAPSSVPGTQTGGNTLGSGGNGVFGNSTNNNGTGGGGGGYHGGMQGLSFGKPNSSGSGASSFISGYSGCDAVNASGTHTGQPNHYSGKVFTNTLMIAGNASMPSPSGGTQTGNTGSGFARITYMP